METRKFNKTVYYIYFPAFILIWIMLFWKCRYGFPSDETFYLLVPYRFINGDLPVLQEWHPSQFSYIWIHPLVSLFLKIKGNTEGIILVFRYIFTACWGLSSLFLFYRARKISVSGAAIASIVFLIYVPFGEMALYYNTIVLMTLTSSAVIVLTAGKWKEFQFFIAGILFAISVSCCPYLAVLYIAMIIRICTRRFRDLKLFLCFSAGIAFIFAIFCIYFLGASSLSECMNYLHYLTDDREHRFSLTAKFLSYFTSIPGSTIGITIVIVIFAVTSLLVFFSKTDRSKLAGLAAVSISSVLLQIFYMIENNYINNYMFAPSIIGLYCVLFSKEDTVHNVFRMIWLPGAVYSLCIHMTSNMGFASIASASTVMTIASFIIAVLFISDIRNNSKKAGLRLAVIALAAVAAFQIGIELYSRINYVFGDASLNYMTEEFDSGCVKGLISTPNRGIYYRCMAYDISPLKDPRYRKVLILSPETWMYLDTEKEISSYSAWQSIIDDTTIDLLEEYYSSFPEKMPDAVYIESYYTGLLPRLNKLGYKGDKTLLGGYILTK